MTAFQAYYYVLLVLWIALLPPAVRLYGRKRAWLLTVAGAGLLATVNEVWQVFWALNAIRIDALMISVVLTLLYVSVVPLLYGARWRRWAALFALVLAAVVGGMSYEWMLINREIQRSTIAFDARNAALFRAKFRDQGTYEGYFGPFDGAATGQPVGHWLPKGASHFTRLIVNGKGRAWLYYRCGEAECAFTPTEKGLERTVDRQRAEFAWHALLRPEIGDALAIRIIPDGADMLRLETRGQVVSFAAAPPPVEPKPAPKTLDYVGPFAAVECTGAHAKLRQLWLWRDGDRLFAVGVFQTLLAGRRANFVTPIVLGEGRRDGGGWRFDWQHNGRDGSATVVLIGETVSLTLKREGQQPESSLLRRESVFRDEAIDFAPLTAGADWQDWFATVLFGHFFAADIPACP